MLAHKARASRSVQNQQNRPEPMRAEPDHMKIDWQYSGRAGPFQVWTSPLREWSKLTLTQDLGKTEITFILTDRDALDMIKCLSDI